MMKHDPIPIHPHSTTHDEDDSTDVLMGERENQVQLDGVALYPGQMLAPPGSGLLRGHGTFVGANGELVSSVNGVLQRVSKLVSVRPFRQRYVQPASVVVASAMLIVH